MRVAGDQLRRNLLQLHIYSSLPVLADSNRALPLRRALLRPLLRSRRSEVCCLWPVLSPIDDGLREERRVFVANRPRENTTVTSGASLIVTSLLSSAQLSVVLWPAKIARSFCLRKISLYESSEIDLQVTWPFIEAWGEKLRPGAIASKAAERSSSNC